MNWWVLSRSIHEQTRWVINRKLDLQFHFKHYICTRQVLHDQLLLKPPRAGMQQE